MAKKLTIVIDADDLASGKVKALSATMTQSTAKVERQQTSTMAKISGAISKYRMATMLATGAAVAFAAKIAHSFVKITAFQDKITKTARSLGVATEFLSSMSFAAERSGTSFEAVNMGLRLLIKRANDANEGLKEATRSFNALGIEVTNQDGTLKKSEQLFLEAADSLSKMEDKTKRAALAQELFGRSGTQLLPLLESGRKGIEELQQKAKELGITFDEEAGRKAEKFQDNLTNLKTSFKGLGMTIVNSTVDIVNSLFPVETELEKVTKASQNNITKFDVLVTTYKRLRDKVNKTSVETKLYKDTIDTLQSSYGEYLKNVNLEKDGYKKIEQSLANARRSLVAYAATQAAIGLQKDLMTELAKKSQEIINLEIKRSEIENRIAQGNFKSTNFTSEDVQLNAALHSTKQKIKNLENDRLKISDQIQKIIDKTGTSLFVQETTQKSIVKDMTGIINQNAAIDKQDKEKMNTIKENLNSVEQLNSLEQQSSIIHNAIAQSIQDEKTDYSELENLYNKSILEVQMIAENQKKVKEEQKQTATYAQFTYDNLLQAGNALAQIIAMSRKGKLKFSSILRIGAMVANIIPGGQAIGAGLGVASTIVGSAGYQTGGSFIVPGKGDRDMPFIIPLTPGEKVDVTPRGGDTITNYQTANNANINIGISANKIDESFMKNEFVPMLKRTLREYNITL